LRTGKRGGERKKQIGVKDTVVITDGVLGGVGNRIRLYRKNKSHRVIQIVKISHVEILYRIKNGKLVGRKEGAGGVERHRNRRRWNLEVVWGDYSE